MRRIRSISVLLLVALLVAASVAVAEDQKTIFYNVTTDDTWASGMALGQAAVAMKEGYKVVVFLNVRAVYLAAKSRAQDSFSGTGKDAHAMIADLIAAGARVIACPMCMKKAGIGEDDLVAGVEKGAPSITLPLMTADDTVVISF